MRVRTAIRAAVQLLASSSKITANHWSRECVPWLDLRMDRGATHITTRRKKWKEAPPSLCLIQLRISRCLLSLMRTVLERSQQKSRSQRTNFGRESWLASPSGWESSFRCFQPTSFARRTVWYQKSLIPSTKTCPHHSNKLCEATLFHRYKFTKSNRSYL